MQTTACVIWVLYHQQNMEDALDVHGFSSSLSLLLFPFFALFCCQTFVSIIAIEVDSNNIYLVENSLVGTTCKPKLENHLCLSCKLEE